jgi:hypothetical protein
MTEYFYTTQLKPMHPPLPRNPTARSASLYNGKLEDEWEEVS